MARRRKQRVNVAELARLFVRIWVLGVGVIVLEVIARYPAMLLLVVPGGIGIGTWRIAIGRRRRQKLADRRRRQYELDVIRSLEIAHYMSMSAGQFEEAIAFLCRRDGCLEAKVVGGTGDLGADVVATTPLGRRLVIQAKRYHPGNLVTGPDLQKFGGTCYIVHRADIALVVTTSAFTKQARTYAAHTNIGLFDQQALAAWASGTGPTPWGTPGLA